MAASAEHKAHSLPQLTAAVPQSLLNWYDAAKRTMPWRGSTDPYAIWLSETMLQQTQVDTVKPFYLRFLQRFPTVAALAAAPLQEVLTHWAGLGYYRRAKHLHAAAQQVVAAHSGLLPPTVEALLTLPGVGRYTAGAVASIAFNLPAPVVDGNVLRVLARLTAYDQDIANPRHHLHFWQTAEAILQSHGRQDPQPRYGDVNQALMELGATLCTPPPAAPACLLCPLQSICRAYAEGRQMELPIKSKKKPSPKVPLSAIAIFRQAKTGREILLMQRPAGSIWEQMWELPTVSSGKGNPPIEQALRLPAKTAKLVGRVKHTLTHRELSLAVYAIDVPANWKLHLPPCPPTNAAPYGAWQWLPYPLPQTPSLPLSRLVHKLLAVL